MACRTWPGLRQQPPQLLLQLQQLSAPLQSQQLLQSLSMLSQVLTELVGTGHPDNQAVIFTYAAAAAAAAAACHTERFGYVAWRLQPLLQPLRLGNPTPGYC
jgi:hypothetical protein